MRVLSGGFLKAPLELSHFTLIINRRPSYLPFQSATSNQLLRRSIKNLSSIRGLLVSAVVEAMSELLNFPETIDKILSASRTNNGNHHHHRGVGSAVLPADILDTPKEYIFYLDVPGLSKSDIQVTVEDENTLVIKSNGKRKREEREEESGSKYVRLERRVQQNLTRKFKLPENCNVAGTSAKCENGVLTVVVEKLPPPPKSKTVQVAIS